MPEARQNGWAGKARSFRPEELSSPHALIAAVDAHDSYTARHSRNTVRLAEAVAERLKLGPEERDEVTLVALLHDVGKLAMSEAVLTKPGPLTPDEWECVRRHPEDGARVVAQVQELAHLAPAIRAGHERWDGGGYPDGLSGEQIPIASRITFVCDAYDAMTSRRPYRPPMSSEAAREQLRAGAGTQFCARCVDALLEVLSPEHELAVSTAAS